jgi:hypothetical protein
MTKSHSQKKTFLFWRGHDEIEDVGSCETKTESDESEEEDDDGSDTKVVTRHIAVPVLLRFFSFFKCNVFSSVAMSLQRRKLASTGSVQTCHAS